MIAGAHRPRPRGTDLNRFIVQLGPFSKVAKPAVCSLGHATTVGRPALVQSKPLVTLLAKFASDANPVGRMLDELTASLDKSGGIEQAMNWIFFQTVAINGFDGVSHYLRAGLITNLCSSYATTPVPGCSANFRETKAITLVERGQAGSDAGPARGGAPRREGHRRQGQADPAGEPARGAAPAHRSEDRRPAQRGPPEHPPRWRPRQRTGQPEQRPGGGHGLPAGEWRRMTRGRGQASNHGEPQF